VGANGGKRAVKDADRGCDQRFPGEEAGVRDEIACREIVGTVGNDVISLDEIERVLRDEPCRVRLDRNMRIALSTLARPISGVL